MIAIVALVGAAWFLLQRQQLSMAGPNSAQLAADLNANQHAVNLQTAGILGAAYQPNTGLATTQAGAGSGLSALQNYNQQQEDQGGGSSALGASIPVIGAVLGIGFSFLAQHTARVKGATAENSGIDAIVPAFDADVREVNAAYRAGSINATMAISYLAQIRDQYWQYMSQFQGKPGVAMRPCPPGQVGGPMGHGGCTSGQPICDRGCTAGCCVGCSAINGAIANCIWAVQTGYHGPVAICEVFAGKFGAHDRTGYQLSW